MKAQAEPPASDMPPEPPDITTAALVDLLSSRRLPTTSEADMHNAIARIMDEAKLEFHHENRIDRHNRPDFVTRTEPSPDRWTAIEVKLRCTSDAAIMRQVIRYAMTGEVSAVLLIVGRHFAFTGHHLEGKDGERIPFHIIRPAL